jgi:hypothetical protein
VRRLAGVLGEEVADREEAVHARHHLARRMVEADVDREQVVHVVEVAALGHRLPAADALLRRLEEHLQRAREVGVLHRLDDADAERRVGVVTARVHVAVALRPEPLVGGMVVVPVGLLDGQRVDVHAQADRRAVAHPELRDEAGVAARQLLQHVLACAVRARTAHPFIEGVVVRHRHALVGREHVRADVDAVHADAL